MDSWWCITVATDLCYNITNYVPAPFFADSLEPIQSFSTEGEEDSDARERIASLFRKGQDKPSPLRKLQQYYDNGPPMDGACYRQSDATTLCSPAGCVGHPSHS